MTILIAGDANADLSALIDRFPHEGDDILVETLGWCSGGSAANVAAALAALGAPTRLLARVGRDPAAEGGLRAARAAGVDLDAIQYDTASPTGLCFAAILPGGERTLFSYRGANAALDLGPGDEKLLNDAKWLHIAGHALLEGKQRSSVRWLCAEAAARRVSISLDLCLPLARARRGEVLELLTAIDVLFTNELELAALFPDLSAEVALEQIVQSEARLAVLKLGAHGCMIGAAGQRQIVPAFAVEAIDTNGCGDAFVAGFLYAHLRQAGPETSAIVANAMGAMVAMRFGAAEAIPDRAQVRAFLSEHAVAALFD
jgi:sugar/nucleoside kinase (ribokinase family)